MSDKDRNGHQVVNENLVQGQVIGERNQVQNFYDYDPRRLSTLDQFELIKKKVENAILNFWCIIIPIAMIIVITSPAIQTYIIRNILAFPLFIGLALLIKRVVENTIVQVYTEDNFKNMK